MFSSDSASFLANSLAPQIGPSQVNNSRNYPQRVNFDPKKSMLFCKYCKKFGHTIDKCYKLHGFPSDFFTKNKRVAASVHMDFTPETPPLSDPQQVVDAPHGFSKEHYAHILSLFQQAQLSSSASTSSSSSTAYANFAGLGRSLKRPLEIGRVEHGLYILHMGSSKSDFVSISYSNVKSSDCYFHSVISPVPSSLVIDSSVLPTSYDYSRVTWTHLLSCRGNAFSIIKAFISMVSTHYNSSVQTIRTDNAFELGSCFSYADFRSSLDVSFVEHIFPSTSSPSTFFPSSDTSFSYSDLFAPPSSPHSPPAPTSLPSSSSVTPSPPPLRRSSRPHNPLVHLQDYVCNFVPQSSALPVMHEPQHYQQVVSNTAWQEAMLKEFQALEANQTWDIVPLLLGKKVIPCK
ncbi:uncharacterized protein [Nicotiana sylvestris]|uniref:uncharacterized protein n=1 Tax=Nicotiana sylvestris TaxID=4096 RepID=UPI00388C3748